ncbi:MAG: 4Fe-4S dicluster domain-containing protein, partial [Anaerolineales bacterium]|nr:4Fe-4S dicluster domain-containing protein [Anaerolineales bacterium]
VLIVEFMGPTAAAQLEALADRGLGDHLHRANSSAEQAKIWELRRAALGLTMSKKGGDAKGISFIEDTAVAPAHLAEYIEKLQAILAKYETEAGFYAHASVGLLHIRPVINLKFSTGVERFAAIADEVADLVLAYGGALSGEHGDGLVRAPFQERMFGPTLYNAFCELKAVFDPENLFNPGKIVNAPPLTENLRFGASYQTPIHATAFDFDDYGGLLRAAEQCSGVGACRQTGSGTMCPSYMATREEKDSTRGRANSLRLALNGQLSELGLADPELREVMALCLECKACASECPTGVDMARLKSEFQHQYRQQHGGSWRERVLGEMATLSRWGSRLAPVSNWLMAPAPARRLLARLLGLDARRPLPRFASRSFAASWRPAIVSGDRPVVALFADTFNNYYEPDNLRAAAQLLDAAGAQVLLAPQVCCGRPLISKGFLDRAARQAAAMTAALLPLVEAGIPVLFSEPSCHSAVLDDHPRLLRGTASAEARRVAEGAWLLESWLAQHGDALTFQPGPAQLLVHGHCHQKALVGMAPLHKLLQRLPGTAVELLDSGCCGQAGLFGYEQYDISQAIGERRLLPAVRALSEAEYLVAPGFSCRHQVDHFTGKQPLAPAVLLARYLEQSPG